VCAAAVAAKINNKAQGAKSDQKKNVQQAASAKPKSNVKNDNNDNKLPVLYRAATTIASVFI